MNNDNTIIIDIYFNFDEKFSLSRIDESFEKYIAEKQKAVYYKTAFENI